MHYFCGNNRRALNSLKLTTELNTYPDTAGHSNLVMLARA